MPTVVTTIQKIGEGNIWAYKNKNSARLGEAFAQAFLDTRMCDQFRELLREKSPEVIGRDQQNQIDNQILQTTLILVQSTPQDSSLLAYLQSGWFLNDVIAHNYNWRNDDLLNLWITFLKDIAMKLSPDNIILFFNPGDPERLFPIFSEAARFYHFPGSQVRTAVQAISLEIITKLTDERLQDGDLFQVICMECNTYFTHVCCLLREFWVFLDHEREGLGAVNGRQSNPRDVRAFDNMQCDVLVYLNDVTCCRIWQITEVIQEKLLRFAVLPILVRSALLGEDAGPAPGGGKPEGILAPSTAWYLLHDLLVHVNLKTDQLIRAVAFALLRPEIPAEVLQLTLSPAARTPLGFAVLQATWTPTARPQFQRERGDNLADEQLYSMPPVPLAMLLEVPTAVRGARQVQNPLLQAFIRLLRTPIPEDDVRSVPLVMVLRVFRVLLRAVASAEESLAEHVVPYLIDALCQLLAHSHHGLRWGAIEAALRALPEVAAASADPPRAKALAEQSLRSQVLQPLAARILSNRPASAAEAADVPWLDLDAFIEQWWLHRQAGNACGDGLQGGGGSRLRRDVLERLPVPPGGNKDEPPEGQPRQLRLLLEVRRLCAELAGSKHGDSWMEDLPGVSEEEFEERARFRLGETINLGKANRLRCTLREPKGTMENFYLVPTGSLLVLVQPDSKAPFWAVPTHVESLRNVRLPPTDDAAGGTLPAQDAKVLRLGIVLPGPPHLCAGSASAPTSTTALGPPPSSGSAGSCAPDVLDGVAPLELSFQDVTRRRMAAAALAKGRGRVLLQMGESLERILAEVRDGRY